MKIIKSFTKKGCDKIELIELLSFGFVIKITRGKKVVQTFKYETLHMALDMFWFCVSLETGISKYIE